MVGLLVGKVPVASDGASRKSRFVRNALAAGAALVVFGHFGAAYAAPFFGGVFDPAPRSGFSDSGPRYAPSNDTYRVRPHYAPSRRVGTKSGKSREGEKTKTPAADVPKGTLQIVVSIGQQRVTLYSNGTRVAQSVVSTGVPGHPTPMGVFSVIQKDRFHHSNLYSNAPMPYMQRITWSGVAMHEGPLPGHPASHGCIRLAHDFAARLWTTTKMGARVFVLRNDMAPEDFSHPKLFQPLEKRPEIAAKPNDDARSMPVTVAQSETRPAGAGADLPGQPYTVSGPAPNALEPSVADTGDGRTAPPVSPSESSSAQPVPAAAVPVKADDPPKPTPAVFEPLRPSSPSIRTSEPTKHSGQVAVFVSRKEKKVFVRQGFEPLFDMPVEIANPDAALGTHVFTALELLDGGSRMRWNVLSIPGAEPRAGARETRRGGRRSVEVPVLDSRPPSSAAQALDRITLPQEAIDRISELLIPGSSLVISDYGLGGETGRSTEFIVVTR
jgi:lipoprotein-anchoring transpeptidase ErfK/SrfK